MNITIDPKALLNATAAAGSAVSVSTTHPMLSHLRVQADPDGLTVTGTDLERSVSAAEPVLSCASAGACVVPAREIIHLARTWPSGTPIHMRMSDPAGPCLLTGGALNYRLPTMPSDDFPAPPSQPPDTQHVIVAGALDELLAQISYAMADNDVRYYLNGALLFGAGDSMTAVATNGHRLACAQRIVTRDDSAPPGAALPAVIVPRKTVLELSKHLARWDGDCVLTTGPGALCLQGPGITVHSKLIDAKYPDYQRVIPTNLWGVVTLDRADLAHAVKRLSGIVVDNRKLAAVRLTLGRDVLSLGVNSQQDRLGEETIPCSTTWSHPTESPDVQIGVNLGYFAEVLGVITRDQIAIHYHDASSPILLRSSDSMDADTHVIMPIRI